MKVLHIINNLKREGAQIVVFNLVTAKSDENIKPVVYARDPGGALQQSLENRGITVQVPDRYYGLADSSRSSRYLDELIVKERIDIVHAHMADAAFLGWLVARKHRLPLVITNHGHALTPQCGVLCRAIHLLLLFFASHYAQRNIAVATAVAERVRRKLFLRKARVTTIANGVPVPTESELGSKSRDKSVNPNICIVTVGRLVELKGQEQLIAAAARLKAEFPYARFVIVGGGPLEGQLRQQAHSLGVSENVELVGAVDDVPAYLRQADVFVSTSHYEGMPLATLEAMAWRVPVVASNVPGNREVVMEGETGLLYPLHEVAALADSIRRVLTDPSAALERAQRARQVVEKSYSIEASARAYAQIYRELAGITIAPTAADVVR